MQSRPSHASQLLIYSLSSNFPIGPVVPALPRFVLKMVDFRVFSGKPANHLLFRPSNSDARQHVPATPWVLPCSLQRLLAQRVWASKFGH